MQQLSFKLNTFEGPLDLLLMLIKKNKVSIYDIPIAEILEQYLIVMQQMKEMDLELSSEFLVMAATLLQIKSKMLLPKEDDDEEEDPRTELVRHLVEYKQIKESIGFFRDHENSDSTLFFKLPDVIERPPAVIDYSALTTDNLLKAYQMSFVKMERKLPPTKTSFSGIVGHEKISIKERVKNIWKKLITKGKMRFKDVFKGIKTKPEAVAAFLAVLEMIKMNKIEVKNTDSAKDCLITKISDDDNFDFGNIEE